jgi:hypothetical protein
LCDRAAFPGDCLSCLQIVMPNDGWQGEPRPIGLNDDLAVKLEAAIGDVSVGNRRALIADVSALTAWPTKAGRGRPEWLT